MRILIVLAFVSALSCGVPSTAPSHLPVQETFVIAAAPPPGFDRQWASQRSQEHLAALVRLDTQNPPGGEMATARYFEEQLRSLPGIETHLLEVDSQRANFVARLHAKNPTGPPVMILGHMDVVGFQEEKWETPPLELTEKDGHLFGRGVIDDKGMLAAAVTALEALSSNRDLLSRDLILLATAAEEGGPPVGVDWVLEHHRDLIGDAAFALNEGGRIRITDGIIQTVNIQTTEKIYHDVRATATGPSGHGSVPLPQNALAALARAASRVHNWRSPVRLNETTRLFFREMARLESDPARAKAMEIMGEERPSVESLESAATLVATDPLMNAVMRTGVSLTVLDGGFRSNVIPSEGTATFNVRTVPGDDIHAVIESMESVANEAQVHFELITEPRDAPPPSPVDTDLFRAMTRAAQDMKPDVAVIPFMSTGATDGAALRAEGIPTYGILPFPLEESDEATFHGDNERMPTAALLWGTEYVYRVLAMIALSP
ncbi:MAG: M20/M25/M40 family metallo-hydrolase [Planctomycetota bacterium]|nr:M20/M25/M40 family metallo-hydrolase [Planctomycetota bacterium]